MDKLRPTGYKVFGQLGELGPVDDLSNAIAESAVGRFGVRAAGGLLERAYSSPRMVSMIPDTKLPYVTLPTIIAEELGEPVTDENTVSPPDLADRIGDLTYDVGDPHIELVDKSFEASGTAVTACPVSAEDFGGGCYRDEMVQTNGTKEHLVSLDTQPASSVAPVPSSPIPSGNTPPAARASSSSRGDLFGDERPVRRPDSGALPPGRAGPRVAGPRPAGRGASDGTVA